MKETKQGRTGEGFCTTTVFISYNSAREACLLSSTDVYFAYILFLLNLGYAIVSSLTLRCKLTVVSFADAA